MITEQGTKALPIQSKSLAITSALTYREYLESSPEPRQLIQTRLSEVRIPPAHQEFLINYPDILNFVFIINEDVPETTIILPIIQRMVATSPRFLLRILRERDAFFLLEAAVNDLELDDDTDIELPLLLVLDEEWNCQIQWGPQPAAADPYLDQWLASNPTVESFSSEGENQEEQGTDPGLFDVLLQEMRIWYNSGLDQECIREICDQLAQLNGVHHAGDDVA